MDPTALKNFDISFKEQAALSEFTTFRLGGPCPVLINCQTPVQLEKALQFCRADKTPYILIGGGSNLVVSDKGVDCRVIRYASEAPLIALEESTLYVAASTLLDVLAHYAAEHGLEGLNCTTGIPGTVGGAIVGNAGAFGRQIGDVIDQVTVFDRSGEQKQLTRKDLQFSYRHSALKATGDIVVSANLTLKRGDADALLKERKEILQTRRAKHPDLKREPCAGSFFRNIEPTSSAERRQAAGWFLDQAGGKSLSSGGAKIFTKHANIIVKSEGCTSQDVYALSQKMAAAVKDKFGLDLVREVHFVGEFDGKPADAGVIW